MMVKYIRENRNNSRINPYDQRINMSKDNYITWVKEVNIELSKFGECLSCFELSNNNLKHWFVDNSTPEVAATELHFIKSLKRKECVCIKKGLKN
jgi:hypothetical protein